MECRSTRRLGELTRSDTRRFEEHAADEAAVARVARSRRPDVGFHDHSLDTGNYEAARLLMRNVRDEVMPESQKLRGHLLPPRPVMAGALSPHIQPVRNIAARENS